MGSNHSITYSAQYKTGGVWVPMPGVLRVHTHVQSSDGGGPFRFGASVLPSATVECGPAAPATGWYRAPFRASVQVTIDGVAHPEEDVFTGILTRRTPGQWGYTFEAAGADGRIRRARVRTPLRYRRALATATTAGSVEDPDDVGYVGGLLNEIFWKSGGRPYEQAHVYPDAAFYYACDGTSVAPEWGWIDTENAWDEALKLAEAAGGQVYQDSRGVMRYVNPLLLAESTPAPLVVADTGPHASGRILYDGRVEVDEDLTAAYNVAVCTFQRRALQAPQEVYKNQDSFEIDPSQYKDHECVTSWPVRWRDQDGAVEYTVEVVACYDDGYGVTPTVTVLEESARVLELRITNPSSTRVIHVDSITITGRPVTVQQQGVARYTGPRFDANDDEDVEIRLNDSVYTQRETAAQRRATLAVYFDGYPRPVYRVGNCPYMPGVTVGQYTLFYSQQLGLVGEPCRIVDQYLDDSGTVMGLALASVVGLPKLSERFVVGTTYALSDVRRVGL